MLGHSGAINGRCYYWHGKYSRMDLGCVNFYLKFA